MAAVYRIVDRPQTLYQTDGGYSPTVSNKTGFGRKIRRSNRHYICTFYATFSPPKPSNQAEESGKGPFRATVAMIKLTTSLCQITSER
jgi:hypothetical protein